MSNLNHKQLATECFNKVWDLLEKSDRTKNETEEMIHLCHTSFWHWTQVQDHTDQNLSIGYWQLSRVYAVAEHGEQALYYAERCVEISKNGELASFYIAYGYEALARSYILLNQKDQAEEAIIQVKRYTELVKIEKSKNLLLEDLADLMKIINDLYA
ncbi:hypothetical protein V7147_05860 [Bacillus sp. JJ1521]|uniref:hypothetical protein n=1 Tax=Bacillus sp. JJ1521 TaxID=3122957 RepID=UPI002FFD9E4C